jgi:ATP-dependent protease ClpP protease subunit
MATEFRTLTFVGAMQRGPGNSLRVALCEMINTGAKKVTILFSSEGGSPNEAIPLFSYLRALPVEITMHAIGPVDSVAIPVFLAGKKRFASKNATFLCHQYHWSFSQAQTDQQTMLREHLAILDSSMNWNMGIIKERTKITDADIESLKLFDHPLILTAARAAELGMVDQVLEPTINRDTDPRVVV